MKTTDEILAEYKVRVSGLFYVQMNALKTEEEKRSYIERLIDTFKEDAVRRIVIQPRESFWQLVCESVRNIRKYIAISKVLSKIPRQKKP